MSSEQQLEERFIQKLLSLKYEYRPDIRDRAALEANFREKFQELNRVKLTDDEFQRLHDEVITPDVFASARTLRTINSFTRDDGTPLNYTLVNIKDWCKNTFEVVNQLRINTDNSHHRYDVILLLNGVPIVQIEFKTLGISPRRAMEQIVDYKNDPGNGYTRTLLSFVQLFIVSNYTDTWYFANNNARHFSFNADERFLPVYQFAAQDNSKIVHLDTFAEKFLEKCTLSEMVSRYMVLVASEQKLLMMRPYQTYAVKAIVECIRLQCGNGYIWHTTGSGKTLTSFKASTLLKDNPDIEKCLFVVDRKDLDRQTREEFNKFQEGCVEENTNTGTLVRRLLSDDYADKVIVTTIQKLGLALDESSKRNKQNRSQGKATYKEQLEPLRDKRMVFIFDECHRSQFGDNHQAIKEFFPKAQLFGFTGTPIFEENASAQKLEGEQGSYRTTQDLFQKELHAYTITHAIEDQNVLRFHVDYYKADGKAPKTGELPAKEAVVEAILDKHDAATGDRRFNAILATASINDAIQYFATFDAVQNGRELADPDYARLNIACVFSPPAEGNKDVQQIQEDLPQEKADNEQDPEGKKKALTAIIADYNARFGTNHSITEFDSYYQNVQKRIKDQQFPNADLPKKGREKIDITIVVDMLLTGFDSKFLNTLYVDKNLKHHGLIQAFSRTNRVLNAAKPYGNVLDFRGQQAPSMRPSPYFRREGEQGPRNLAGGQGPEGDREAQDRRRRSERLHGVAEARTEARGRAQPEGGRCPCGLHQQVQGSAAAQNPARPIHRPHAGEQDGRSSGILPKEKLKGFRGVYLETAQRLKEQQGRRASDQANPKGSNWISNSCSLPPQLLITTTSWRCLPATPQQAPGKQKMSRDQLIGLIQSDAKFMDDRDDIAAYINTLKAARDWREGYPRRLPALQGGGNAGNSPPSPGNTGWRPPRCKVSWIRSLAGWSSTVNNSRTCWLRWNSNWRDRREKELALMDDLLPLLKKVAGGREISGLNAYEQ